MLLHQTDNGILKYSDVVNARGNEDYVQDGIIHRNESMQMVLISNASDLDLLTEYEPGTIAHTAGFHTMWQKSPSGDWVEM